MSQRRDLMWFRFADMITGSMNDEALVVASVGANATNIIHGGVPGDAHSRLAGTIEHIGVIAKTGATVDIDVIFFRGAAADAATYTDDLYIDHESFINTDFVDYGASTAPQRAAKSGLSIPYVDTDGSKMFHIGIQNVGGSTLTVSDMDIEIAWRPDVGE